MDIAVFFHYNDSGKFYRKGGIDLQIQKQKDFLVSFAYWAIIATVAYLALKYVLPLTVPFIIGILIAQLVVWISRKIHCTRKLLRIGLAILIYGVLGLLISLLAAKGISTITTMIKWLVGLYETKLLPLVTLVYEWGDQTIQLLDPSLVSALKALLQSLLSAAKDLLSYLSGLAVNLVSSVATGVPSLVLSLLAMIFSTVFVVSDYEHIAQFASQHIPQTVKKILVRIKLYLTGTLFVVIRSYALIMLLTFTELSILFTVFGIDRAVLKATLIAFLDILPILGTGGIMIPWAVISFVLGDASMGIRLLVIYGIVTIVRNYVEPKIVGTQLGLHPIITLTSMFIGLRLFGFWGLFGLPVAISFLWKEQRERKNRETASDTSSASEP